MGAVGFSSIQVTTPPRTIAAHQTTSMMIGVSANSLGSINRHRSIGDVPAAGEKPFGFNPDATHVSVVDYTDWQHCRATIIIQELRTVNKLLSYA